MMDVLTGVAFAGTFGSIVVALVASNALFRLLYSNHREEWERIGCPAGMWSVPQEILDAPTRKGFRSSLAATRALWAWLFRTPEWIKTEEKARSALHRMRVATVTAYIGMAVFLVSFFVSAF